VSDGLLKIKTAILSSYYLPGVDQDKILFSSITPVNSFRLIFNYYFGEDYELLPDDIFIPEKGYLYKFLNVNSRLR